MNAILIIAGSLAFFIGFIHSFLGEKYLLIPLFRRTDLPRLFGSDWFTRRTLRFVWHSTSIAWWGYAGILLLSQLSPSLPFRSIVFLSTSGVFFLSSVVTFGFTHGKHLAWIIFLLIAAGTLYATLIF